jgi:polyhydroxybutyrate depolymerase
VRRRWQWAASLGLVATALLTGGLAAPSWMASPAHATTTVIRNPLAPGDHVITLKVGGQVRRLILHVPPGSTKVNRPLILVYHGALDTASNTISETDFEQVANQHGQLVAFMQGYANTWNEGAGHTPAEQANIDDVAYTSAAITKVEGFVRFNHAHIAAVGFSNGALMVEDLGCRLAQRLALIVPVEGELPVSVSATCAPARPISVLEIHGTGDQAIPYAGGPFAGVGGGTTVLSATQSVARWAALDGCSSTPTMRTPDPSYRLTTYSGCPKGISVALRTITNGGHVWTASIGEIVTQAIPR